jgi:hypothetical protein
MGLRLTHRVAFILSPEVLCLLICIFRELIKIPLITIGNIKKLPQSRERLVGDIEEVRYRNI